MGAGKKSMTCGIYMLHASEALRAIFPIAPIPAKENLYRRGRADFTDEIDFFVKGLSWEQLAEPSHFSLRRINKPVDLGDIFFSISDKGVVYYIPGFLLYLLTSYLAPSADFIFIREEILRGFIKRTAQMFENDAAERGPFSKKQISVILDSLMEIYKLRCIDIERRGGDICDDTGNFMKKLIEVIAIKSKL